MKNIQKLIPVLFLICSSQLSAQGLLCNAADPFCTDSTEIFLNTFNGSTAEPGPDYGCLGSQPNPAWYFLKISQSGLIEITIEQTDFNSFGLDVDFIMYGPFPDPVTPCTSLLTGGCAGDHNCFGNTVDCSFNPAPIEVATIPNAIVGEYYLLLITNFDGDPGVITFSQTGGTGATDCSILIPCVADAGNNATICLGDSLILGGSPAASGGDSTFVYAWSPATGLNDSTLANPTASPTITTTYLLTIDDENGCISTDSVTITVNQPSSSIQNPTICQGQNFTLPGGTIVTNQGVFLDTLTNATGCDSIITTNLTVNPLADASITTTKTNYCINDANLLLTSANPNGIWSGNGIVNTTSGEFSPANAGIGMHPITYSISGMCGDSDTLLITINANPEISLTAIEDTCDASRGSILTSIIAGIPPFTFVWNNGETTQNISNLIFNTYSVTITDATNCMDNEQIVVGNIDIGCEIIIPNVITPNGDGMNDLLVFQNLEFFPENKLTIFNRWGKKLFETTNYKNDWDASEYSDGTYYFILEITKTNTTHKGTITVLN